MTASTLAAGSEALTGLIGRLDSACIAPAESMGAAIAEALKRACAQPDLLSPLQCCGRKDHYARHVLHADPAGRYTVVALVWEPGQMTPVHGHYAWCSYAVVSGLLHEERYLRACDPQAVSCTGSADRAPGYYCFSHAGLDEIHRLGNRGDVPAISVHVYGVDAPRIATHVNRVLLAG